MSFHVYKYMRFLSLHCTGFVELDYLFKEASVLYCEEDREMKSASSKTSSTSVLHVSLELYGEILYQFQFTKCIV